MTIILAVPASVSAQARSVSALRWDTTIDAIDTAQNSFTVTETQTLEFTGTFTFGLRTITLNNLDDLSDFTVHVDSTALTPDCSERPATFCMTTRDGETQVRYFFPIPVTNDSLTVEIAYTVHGALRIYDGGDQLWKHRLKQKHRPAWRILPLRTQPLLVAWEQRHLAHILRPHQPRHQPL